MPDLPPEPERPKNMSDKDFKAWKKAHAQWQRMVRDAAGDPVRNEEEAIERAKQKGDRDFEQGIEELLGYSLDEVRDAFRSADPDDLSIAERAAYDALKRADNAWFFKGSAQRDAHKKIKKARGDIGRRVRAGKCSLWALAVLAVASFEVIVIASGVVEVVQAVTP